MVYIFITCCINVQSSSGKVRRGAGIPGATGILEGGTVSTEQTAMQRKELIIFYPTSIHNYPIYTYKEETF